MRKSTPQEKIALMIALKEKCPEMTYVELAKKVGVSPPTAHKYLKAAGLNNNSNSKISPEKHDEITKLKQENHNLSDKEIAEIVGVSTSTVYSHLTAANLNTLYNQTNQSSREENYPLHYSTLLDPNQPREPLSKRTLEYLEKIAFSYQDSEKVLSLLKACTVQQNGRAFVLTETLEDFCEGEKKARKTREPHFGKLRDKLDSYLSHIIATTEELKKWPNPETREEWQAYLAQTIFMRSRSNSPLGIAPRTTQSRGYF